MLQGWVRVSVEKRAARVAAGGKTLCHLRGWGRGEGIPTQLWRSRGQEEGAMRVELGKSIRFSHLVSCRRKVKIQGVCIYFLYLLIIQLNVKGRQLICSF